MIKKTGLLFLVSALCLAMPYQAYAQTNQSPTNQTQPSLDKYKAQLAAAATAAKAVPLEEKTLSPNAAQDVQAIDEADLIEAEEPEFAPVAEDSAEIAPLRISLDKPELVRLERDAVNVVVGSNENLRVVPDTNKTLLLIPKKPGSTYFQALDVDGKIIMQRHVIIGSPNKNYIRIRRACSNGMAGCKQYSVYYCPDICHEVNVVQDTLGPRSAIPDETPMGSAANNGDGNSQGNGENEIPPAEPPPGE